MPIFWPIRQSVALFWVACTINSTLFLLWLRNQHTVEGVSRLLYAKGIKANQEVYIISARSDLDTMTLPLHDALQHILTDGDTGTIVSCIAGKLAYYCPEEPASGYIFAKPIPGR